MFCVNMKCLYLLVLLQILVVCYSDSLEKEKVELPPPIFPEDNSTYKIISGNDTILNTSREITVPLLFPEQGSNYTIIRNKTILKSLVSHTNSNNAENNKKIDTEVDDLLNTSEETEILPGVTIGNKTHEEKEKENENGTTTKSVNHETMGAKEIELTTVTSLVSRDPQLDAELIQSDVTQTEDKRLNQSDLKLSSIHVDHGHPLRGGTPVLEGQLAAILAGVFVLIAVVCYVALLTWRRYLEHRYGNREMLINEEDYVSYNDMKNFEI